MISALAEHLVAHHGANCVARLLTRHSDYNALAKSKSVRLNDRGDRSSLKICQRRVHVVKDLVCGGRNTVFFHKILGKDLASFNYSRVCARAEARYSLPFKSVYRAENQRIVGRNYRVVNTLLNGKIHNAVNVLCADINTYSVSRNTAVTGQSVYLAYCGIFFYFLDDGVFTTATANYHYFHKSVSPALFVGEL